MCFGKQCEFIKVYYRIMVYIYIKYFIEEACYYWIKSDVNSLALSFVFVVMKEWLYPGSSLERRKHTSPYSTLT